MTTRAANKLAKVSLSYASFEEVKDEEIVGVNVLPLSEMTENPLGKRNAAGKKTVEEAKFAEIVQVPLPDPKKRQTLKKAATHRDEGAFQTYIYRVCKEVCPDSAISKKAMTMLNQIVADKFEQIMSESRGLIVNTKKGTLTSKEVETACKLLIPGELGDNAIKNGREALTKFSTE